MCDLVLEFAGFCMDLTAATVFHFTIRDGRWKLLLNADGTQPELYDFSKSQLERENVAAAHPEVVRRLSKRALDWRKSLPKLETLRT